MPDEFRLRPYDECETLDNYFHEQGARALAAAIVEVIDEGKPPKDSGDDDGIYINGWDDGYASAMADVKDIIHRLVPQCAGNGDGGKEKA